MIRVYSVKSAASHNLDCSKIIRTLKLPQNTNQIHL